MYSTCSLRRLWVPGRGPRRKFYLSEGRQRGHLATLLSGPFFNVTQSFVWIPPTAHLRANAFYPGACKKTALAFREHGQLPRLPPPPPQTDSKPEASIFCLCVRQISHSLSPTVTEELVSVCLVYVGSRVCVGGGL